MKKKAIWALIGVIGLIGFVIFVVLWVVGSRVWESVTAAATCVGAAGVFFVCRQVQQAEEAERSRLEDMLCQEYRELLKEIPYDALINKDICLDVKTLNWFYRYFDLANGEFFMARCKRVRADTWKEWQEGIYDNLKLVAFKKAWQEIEPRLAGYKNSFCTFSGLRWIIRTKFMKAPTKFNSKECGRMPCMNTDCGKLPETTKD